MKKPIRIFLMIVILFISTGCGSLSQRFTSGDKFYVDYGDWDYSRLPLVKPYALTNLFDSHGWHTALQYNNHPENTPDYLMISYVHDLSIHENIILLHSEDSPNEDLMNYFVLIPDQEIEMGFETEEEMVTFLKDYDMDDIQWMDVSDQYSGFVSTGCLDWIPDCQPAE